MAKPKKSVRTKQLKRDWQLYTMLIAMVVCLGVFSYYPMLGIQLAFKDFRIAIGNQSGGVWGSPWATTDGRLDLFKHFKQLFSNPDVFKTFLNTLRLSGLRLLFGFPVPIIMALFLNEMTGERYKKVVQSISYLPYFISWVIIAGILTDLTATGSSLQNLFAKLFGHPIEFFGDADLFLGLLIVSDIWKTAGWGTVIYFAALTGIDPSLYEAAEVDGANRWRRMWHITLPGILPAVTINLIFAISGIVYGGFDQVYNMYNRTVYDKADILETYIFRTGVVGGDYSLGTALGLFNSSIAFALTLIANKIVKRLGGSGIW
ncbi:MAG: sugar ABC transporter permease [Clostridia bacterium]|jgi:putative aldouronate transport system permease protein|nr:sugar ABC transporter permease [Clostridia bacterium]